MVCVGVDLQLDGPREMTLSIIEPGVLQDDDLEDVISFEHRKLKKIAAMDQLVDLMLSAASRDELVKRVSENILALNQDFWLRMASRSDSGDAETKERIASLSKAIMTITETLVKMTENQLDDSSELMVEILTAAADEQGHWDLPLAPDKITALKEALKNHSDRLDEAFLSTAFAWIRKSMEDNIEGMVPLMQRMLQLYASQCLYTESSDPFISFLNNLMDESYERWSSMIRQAATEGIIDYDRFAAFIDTKIESMIDISSGSHKQRVQAEFLAKLKEEGRLALEEGNGGPGRGKTEV